MKHYPLHSQITTICAASCRLYMFFLSWSLNDSRSNMRIVWKYVRKTRGFDKNWRKLSSELWSVGEEETEYRLIPMSSFWQSLCRFCSFRRRFL